MRAAGAGIGAFFCPTGVGTPLAEGKETRDDRRARLRARVPDPRRRRADQGAIAPTATATSSTARPRATSARSWPTAARTTIVQVDEVVEPATLDPEVVVTPGIYVDRIVVRRPAGEHAAWRSSTRPRPAASEIAALVARDIPPGSYVNLGIGQPTTVADHLDPEAGVVLHTENGMLGMGRAAHGDEIDPDLINAGKIPVTETPGASYFHHADSLRDDARRPPRRVRARRVPGLRRRRPRQLAHRRPRRDPGRRRRDGSRHRRQGRLRDDDAVRQGRHAKLVAECTYPLTGRALRHAASTPSTPCSRSRADGVRVEETYGISAAELRDRVPIQNLEVTVESGVFVKPVHLAPNTLASFYRGAGRIAGFRRDEAVDPTHAEDWIASTTTRWDRRDGTDSPGRRRQPSPTLSRPVHTTGSGRPMSNNMAPPARSSVKLLDAGNRLPLHVHPDRSFAVRASRLPVRQERSLVGPRRRTWIKRPPRLLSRPDRVRARPPGRRPGHDDALRGQLTRFHSAQVTSCSARAKSRTPSAPER